MKISKASCSIKFKRILKINSQKFTEIQNLLGTDFQDLTPTPFQDDSLPPEIPRYVAKSYYGHAEMHIALNQIQLTIKVDDNYSQSNDKVFNYFSKRLEQAKKVAGLLTSTFDFSGVNVNVIFGKDEVADEFISNLNIQMNSMGSSELYEYDHKFAIIKDEYKYVNLKFTNPVDKLQRVDRISEANFSNQLSVFVDVNDRHGFNYLKGYQSNMKTMDSNFDLLKDIIENKICKIVKGIKVVL